MHQSSHSVGNIKNLFSWFSENFNFFIMRIKGLKNHDVKMNLILKDINTYALQYKKITRNILINANILEIGYGARPNRLITMMSLGLKAKGIDLDYPVLAFNVLDLIQVYKKNGVKRFLKSFIRSLFFDKYEKYSLNKSLNKRGVKLKYVKDNFLVGDASSFKFEPLSIDFIYSEDVFEHIPIKKMHKICKNLNEALSLNGVAFISPSIFAGISGGHLVEWYPHLMNSSINRKSEPWEHLRKKRFVADCYLNELRLHDYKKIFNQYFSVFKIVNHNPGLGRKFLTSKIRKELFKYNDEELLSDKWTFILKKKVK